jgi:hypothetical protein
MKATNNGSLVSVPDCLIKIPGASFNGSDYGEILLNNLPDISDSKNAVYNGEAIIGRSFPLYTYSHSADRSINMQLHFFIVNPDDGSRNLRYLRMIQSAVYPKNGKTSNTPYQPPPVCKIKCGELLDDKELCVILQSYSVKFPTDVAWDEKTYCPYRFDIDTTWLAVYTSNKLPYQEDIISAAINSRIFSSSRG